MPAASSIRTARPARSSWSADDAGNAEEQLAGEIQQQPEHPRTGDGERRRHGEDLRNEAQGHLVDLRRRLQHADQQAGGKRGEQRHGSEQHHGPHGVARQRHDGIGRHPAPPKLLTSVPTSSTQPSASTNSISLNGSEISIGETIIMPSDISTLATSRSMITKGMNSMKPIWKAVLSSLVTNAGISTRSGIASVDSTSSMPARSRNIATSFSRVCRSMKPRSGCAARSMATSAGISSSR